MNRDLTEISIENKLRSDIYTVLPARVIDVSNLTSKQTINVKPLIGRKYQDGTNLPTQEIHNVPLIFPAAGGGIISFPIKVGDNVLLLFSMRDIDNWEDSNGQEVLPTPTTRHHSITDAIAIAGLYTTITNLSPNPDDVEVKFSGSSWKLKPNGDVTLDVAGNYIVNVAGDQVVNTGGSTTLNTTGSTTIQASGVDIDSGSLEHNGTNVGDDHIHQQGNDSDNNTQQPTSGPE